MSAAEWQEEFDKYRAIPEYQLQNKGMSLSEFKVIYWWEWGHRQLGRVIGLVWAVGFVGFLITRKIPPGWTGRCSSLGFLGGAQGAIGWWMVSSGLDTARCWTWRVIGWPRIWGWPLLSSGSIAWYAMLAWPRRARVDAGAAGRGSASFWAWHRAHAFCVPANLDWLALVAGIDAGRSYTDWPLMAGGSLPPDFWIAELGLRNIFENPGLVQFIVHRVTGYLVLAFGIVVWLKGRRSAHPRTRAAFNAAFIALDPAQVVLGIVTVLYVAAWQVAIVHQVLAVVLVGVDPAGAVLGTISTRAIGKRVNCMTAFDD